VTRKRPAPRQSVAAAIEGVAPLARAARAIELDPKDPLWRRLGFGRLGGVERDAEPRRRCR